jgi:hypothetical protein
MEALLYITSMCWISNMDVKPINKAQLIDSTNT